MTIGFCQVCKRTHDLSSSACPIVNPDPNNTIFDPELARKLSKRVHERCSNAPHDIGIDLAEIVQHHQTVGSEPYIDGDLEKFFGCCPTSGQWNKHEDESCDYTDRPTVKIHGMNYYENHIIRKLPIVTGDPRKK